MFHSIFISIIIYSVSAFSHCQVPCGIYDDNRQFATMLEHTRTIHTSVDSIQALFSQADQINQTTRWIMTKEQHATDIQNIMSQYFLIQRIKPSNSKEYFSLLKQAHVVMRRAMIVKQSTDILNVDQLKVSLEEFQYLYQQSR